MRQNEDISELEKLQTVNKIKKSFGRCFYNDDYSLRHSLCLKQTPKLCFILGRYGH